MSDGNRDDRVRAGEPVKDGGGGGSAGQPHGTVSPDPAEANDRANAIDEETAGDGVAFFEGGDGREEARGDMERGA